jgi:hypothetical protein
LWAQQRTSRLSIHINRMNSNGGAGGIRTLDRALQPYNGLANRRLQPLGHSSISADMPDARASRKRQIQITARPFGGAGASRGFLTNGRYPVSRVWAHVSGLHGLGDTPAAQRARRDT